MRVIGLSGGGSRLFFQVQALAGLIEAMQGTEPILWAGVSAGAIVAAYMAQYDDPKEGVAALQKVLSRLRSKDIYQKHGWGFLPAWFVLAMRRVSLFSSAPLRRFLHAHIDPARLKSSRHKAIVGVYNYTKRAYEEATSDHPLFLDFVLASASFPFVFPAVFLGGSWYGDGGIQNNIPVLWAKHTRPSSVSLVLTSSLHATPPGEFHLSFSALAERVVRSMERETLKEDLLRLRSALPGVPIEILYPALPLHGGLFDFDEANRLAFQAVPAATRIWTPTHTLLDGD